MIIKEINATIFDEFAKTYPFSNYFQTSNYGMLMKNFKYEIMYIGAYKNARLVAASLIIYKAIAPTIKYGYAPRGFLIDYFDEKLLEEFTIKLRAFFLLKNFAFVKLDPEFIYSKITIDDKKKYIGQKNKNIVSLMRKLGYQKLKNNLYFEAMLPKFNAFINLEDFGKTSVTNKCYTKSHSIITSSLKLIKGSKKRIGVFYDFIKTKTDKTFKYYEDLYTVFDKNEMADLLLVEIDYYKCLEIYEKKYESFLIENEDINKLFSLNPTDISLYNKKMKSDSKLNELKHIIDLINIKLKSSIEKEIIGGSLLIKQGARVNLVISGFNDDFDTSNFKYFLYYKFSEFYKKLGYSYLDLNGLSGNFTEGNPYKKLNDFKLNFNPDIYEYIGEFDLVINNTYYNILWNSGKLKKEFIN